MALNAARREKTIGAYFAGFTRLPDGIPAVWIETAAVAAYLGGRTHEA